jgi:hypothetical protein
MENIKKYLESYLLKLGFNDANAASGASQLISLALEDTYAELLEEQKLKEVVQAMAEMNEQKILEMNKGIEASKFNDTFLEMIKKNLSLFVQEMIKQMPEQYHEQMEAKLKSLELELNETSDK